MEKIADKLMVIIGMIVMIIFLNTFLYDSFNGLLYLILNSFIFVAIGLCCMVVRNEYLGKNINNVK
jgi:hypothetical protein